MTADLLHGDVLEMLATLPDNSFDGLLSDPPYGLSFMGKAWDHGVPSAAVWRECLRVLKPGAPLLAFGGTRTYHRLTCAIEDAGFEIRDCLMWIYGQGFPKSLDVSKALDKAAGAERAVTGSRRGTGNKSMCGEAEGKGFGTTVSITTPATAAAQAWSGYGTSLKPAWESILLARKPMDGTVAKNLAKWGVGALAIDASRIGTEARTNAPAGNKPGGNAYQMSSVGMPIDAEGRECVGRWPANIILDEEAGAALDEQTGVLKSGQLNAGHKQGSGRTSFQGMNAGNVIQRDYGGDSGGASRFFYCPKASKAERERGCEGLPVRFSYVTDPETGEVFAVEEKNKNNHPCVKPQALIRYLAGLILPPNPGALLVPYSGSGSEVMGALAAGWPKVVGIELEADYIAIARARIGKAA